MNKRQTTSIFTSQFLDSLVTIFNSGEIPQLTHNVSTKFLSHTFKWNVRRTTKKQTLTFYWYDAWSYYLEKLVNMTRNDSTVKVLYYTDLWTSYGITIIVPTFTIQ